MTADIIGRLMLSKRRWTRHPVAIATIIATLFYISVAPTLTMLQFSSGSENLNVATVLEMRRGGPWLIPTLRGEQRLAKPPLTAWTSASLVSPETIRLLSTADQATRDAAYRLLAWEIRWPALVMSCVTLALIFEMGRLLAGPRVGVVAAVVAGSTLMFLRFGRVATTDVQLALWVTATNVLLLHAVVRGRLWIGLCGAGIALGLAVMSKGPVAFVQTIVPVGIWFGYAIYSSKRLQRPLLTWLPPLVVGLLLMLVIALPWFGWVYWKTPNIIEAWKSEVTREGATNLDPDPWYGYLLLPWAAPWSAFFVIGLIMAVRAVWRGSRRWLLTLALLVVPVLVMSFFKDKPERYLQPMLGPAAIITAMAMRGQFRAWRRRNNPDRVLAVIQWCVVAVLAVGVPIAGAMIPQMRATDGSQWYTPSFAAIAAIAGAGLVAWSIYVGRRSGWGFVLSAAAVVLVAHPIILKGYGRSFSGLAELKPSADHIWATLPDADVSYVSPAGPYKMQPADISIYLNRLVKTVGSVEEIDVHSGRPQAAIVLQRGRDPLPNPPAPWRVTDTVPWGEKRWWHVLEYDVPPATAPPSVAALP